MTRCDIKINCKSSLSPFFSVSVLYTIIFPTSLKIYFLISYHECYHAFSQISERTMWAFRNDFERTQTRGDVTYSIYSTLLFSSLLFSFLFFSLSSFLFPLFFSLPFFFSLLVSSLPSYQTALERKLSGMILSLSFVLTAESYK